MGRRPQCLGPADRLHRVDSQGDPHQGRTDLRAVRLLEHDLERDHHLGPDRRQLGLLGIRDGPVGSLYNVVPEPRETIHERRPSMATPWLLVGLILALPGPGVESTPPGHRVGLGVDGASLFVPDGYRPGAGGAVDVLLHLHGAASVVEPALVDARWPAVLIVFNRKGLSRVYAEPFSDPGLFPRLLEAARTALKDLHVCGEPRIGRVVVSSFSAGFGGVRALLRVPEHFARIDGLIMADSIYCGFTGAPKDRRVDPALMEGFRRFALEAAAG